MFLLKFSPKGGVGDHTHSYLFQYFYQRSITLRNQLYHVSGHVKYCLQFIPYVLQFIFVVGRCDRMTWINVTLCTFVTLVFSYVESQIFTQKSPFYFFQAFM